MDIINTYKKNKELLDLVEGVEDVTRYVSCLKEQQELTKRFLISTMHNAAKINDVATVKEIQELLTLEGM